MSVAIDGDTIVAGAPGGNAAYVFVKPAGGWVNSTQTASSGARHRLLRGPRRRGGRRGRRDRRRRAVRQRGGRRQRGRGLRVREARRRVVYTTQSATLLNYYGGQGDLLGASVATNATRSSPARGAQTPTPASPTSSTSPAPRGASSTAAWNGTRPGSPRRTARATTCSVGRSRWTAPSSSWARRTTRSRAGSRRARRTCTSALDAVSWPNRAKLTAADGTNNDLFGWSVGIAGNRIVAGAIGDDAFRGAAYVFVNPETGWQNTAQTARVARFRRHGARLLSAPRRRSRERRSRSASTRTASARTHARAPPASSRSRPLRTALCVGRRRWSRERAPHTPRASATAATGAWRPDAVRWIASGGVPEQRGTTVSYPGSPHPARTRCECAPPTAGKRVPGDHVHRRGRPRTARGRRR